MDWWNSEKAKVRYRSVLFVSPTPGGVLAKEVRQRLAEINKNSDENILVVEKGGLKIKDMLGTRSQLKKSKCVEKSCPLCTKSTFVEPNSEEPQIKGLHKKT